MASARKTRLKALKKLLASDADDRVEQAVALGPDALSALLETLSAEGLGFQPSWRVKRDLWPHVHQTLGAVIAAQIDVLDADGLHRLVPPALWTEAVHSDDATQAQGIAFVRVPAAATTLGLRASDDKYAKEDTHPVVVSRDLWVSTTPITFRHWDAVVGNAPVDLEPDTPAFVFHAGAVRFCNALSEKEGLKPAYDADGALTDLGAEGYRLLTEAEWEHAARAGTETATYAGDVKVHYGANPHLDPAIRYGESRSTPTPPVATRLPNATGLYDMLGLVWERVEDEWSARRPQGIDPHFSGADLPDEARGVHVIRGGSHVNFASLCTAATRLDDKRKRQAFRIARPASAPHADLLAAAPPEAPAVTTSKWRDIALELPHARPRALFTRDDRTWVGVAGSLATALHGVYVADANLMEVLHELRTPYLASDVHVTGDTLWVGLGPGHLYAYPNRGEGTDGVLEQQVTNAPVFASHDDTLVIGTTWQGFGIRREVWVDGLRNKMLYSVAVDAERLYAGFEDQKTRVYDRTGRRLRVLKTGHRISLAPDGTLWVVNRKGAATAHDPVSGAELRSFQHEKNSPYATSIRAWGDRVISWDQGSVQVSDADGTRVLRWVCPDGASVNDVFPIDADLHVAVGDREACTGRVVRLTVG